MANVQNAFQEQDSVLKNLRSCHTTGDAGEDAREAAKIFRKKYEVNNLHTETAGEYASELLNELKVLGVVDEKGKWKMGPDISISHGLRGSCMYVR